MTKYLFSFPSTAMQVQENELEKVGRDAHAIIKKAPKTTTRPPQFPAFFENLSI